ncbi:MAG: Kelch repeat-containing protein [Planctomycetota bacterium]|jgi:N-acetylneuraminic acid mutarotase
MKTTKVVVIVVLASGMAANVANADGIWTQKADMPTTRYGFSTSVVGGKIYAFGGWRTLTRVDEYDPVTDAWTKKADLPVEMYLLSTCVVNEKIYVTGGLSGSNRPISTVEVYDPATGTLALQTEHPKPRWGHSTSVVDGIIYVIGGAIRNESEGRTYHYGTVEAYDPSTDTWTPKADMPTGRSLFSTCVVGGIIYAIGGMPAAFDYLAPVEAYDPRTDTWTKKAPMPTARYLLDTSVVGGKIYAIGGYRHSMQGPLYSAVEVYDPVMDTWTKEDDIPIPTAGLSTSVVDGKIYVIGGALTTHNGHPWVFTSAVYASDSIVDFNGDGTVDAADMCIMIDHWGTGESLCDIAPAPFGDGIVDVQDLIVLAEHLFTYPGAVAYWKLDETEGSSAHDSAGDNDGTVNGNPLWQPTGGQIDGALQFDGINDYVSTSFILDPADGVFSVFAWVKDAAPGQVIISQTGGANWLLADPSEGKLQTSLLRPAGGRIVPQPLISEIIITDGNWHRVGFVWDSSDRILYVDDMEVARDTQSGLEPSESGLYIGVGKNLEPDSFFSGLIDDVRMYDRAVTP